MRHNRMSWPTGFTLIETILYLTILLLAMSAIYGVLMGTHRYFQIADSSVEVERSAHVAMRGLTSELAESNATPIIWDSSTNPGPGIIFPSIRSTTGTVSYNTAGKILWQKFVCYYVDTGSPQKLTRKEVGITATATVPTAPTTHNTVSEFSGDASLSKRVVANNVQTFTVTVSNACKVVLTCQNVQFNTNTFAITNYVTLQN